MTVEKRSPVVFRSHCVAHLLSLTLRVRDEPFIPELTTILIPHGVSAFATAYSSIRQHVSVAWHERKAKRAVHFAANPVAAARQNIRKTANSF